MSNDINSRILANADAFFAWDVVTYLFSALVLAFAVVVIDAVFFERKRAGSEVQSANQSKLGKFFYFLIFLKLSKNEKYSHRPKIVQWSIEFFPILILVIVFRGFVFEPFRVPSNSMMPTLLTGDFIIVNKFDYGLRLPITNTKLVEFSTPDRGDIVVFRYPNYERNDSYSGVDFIKRVIGLPGDVISYQGDKLTLNGEAVDYNKIGSYKGVDSGRAMSGYNHVREQLEGANHDVLLSTIRPSPQFPEITVPEGHYFVMGDNRSNSGDSRAWGYVPESYVIGKAVGVWMHWDWNYNTMQFSRIGGID
ncbi:MAG: signal peptidase I [Gammaproteobacteria bacterium]|nr:signal peptidase I [Gammaproteobacteria bacterium]